MSTLPNLTPADDTTLRLLVDQYRRNPDAAGWFAVGAASDALERGDSYRAQQILEAARTLLAGGEVR
jgi:hypothetical protein